MSNLSVRTSEGNRMDGDIKTIMHSTGMEQESKREGGGGHRRHNVLDGRLLI